MKVSMLESPVNETPPIGRRTGISAGRLALESYQKL